MTSQEPDRPKDTALPEVERWQFRLYVAGRTPRASVAYANLKQVCDANLAGRYRIEVVDLTKQPAVAIDDQVLAVPTVVRTCPGPPRRVVGDLSNAARVVHGLDIAPNSAA